MTATPQPKQSPGLLPSLAEFLGLRRNTSLLLVMLVLAGTGEKLWIGFAPKYLEWLGASVFVIGSFDAVQTLLGAVYAFPGGWMTDLWGERRSLVFFNVLSIAGYAVVMVWEHWLAVVVGAFLFLAWSALSLPATFSVVAATLESHKHTMGIGVQSMVRRVPMMVGPLIGGWLIARHGWRHGVQLALAGSILLGVVTAFFQWLMTDEAPRERRRPAAQASLLQIVRSFTPVLRELLVSDILIRFCERIPYAFVVLWAMDHGGMSAQQFSWLVSIEMATAMLCYIPVAHLTARYGRRPFVLATFGFFTLFPLLLVSARDFSGFAVAFAVRGLKEFGEPARKSIIVGEAPPEWRARTYGAYYLIRDCTVTAGSFLGAWLWTISPRANFIGAAVFGALGTTWFWWYLARKADRFRKANA